MPVHVSQYCIIAALQRDVQVSAETLPDHFDKFISDLKRLDGTQTDAGMLTPGQQVPHEAGKRRPRFQIKTILADMDAAQNDLRAAPIDRLIE
jgi:hypothetical protein